MPSSNAELYGSGVFTTVAFRGGEPFLWEKHWRRLTENAAAVDIDLTNHSNQGTRQAVDSLFSKTKLVEGRARITFFDERPSEVWSTDTRPGRKIRLNIIVGERRSVPKNFKLTVSSHPVNSRSPLAGVKSCNYLENILTLNEAKNRGFDEAVRLNENGKVTSVSMANLFWLKDDVLYTPSLSTGCLAGTTREFVLENLDCNEVEVEIDAIRSADAIFLTSAGLGVAQVAEFESRKLPDIDHPIKTVLPWTR